MTIEGIEAKLDELEDAIFHLGLRIKARQAAFWITLFFAIWGWSR